VSDDLTDFDAIVIGPDYSDSFASNIAAGLRSWGIPTAVLDPNRSFVRHGTIGSYSPFGLLITEVVRRSPTSRRLLVDRPIEASLRGMNPALVVCVSSDVRPEQVERWREVIPEATWVFWYPDALSNLGAHRVLVAPYDHFFFKEPYLVEVLSARTALRVHMLADACNPDHHRTETPRDDDEKRRYACDVAVAGNLYPYRLLVMGGIPDDVSLKVYGNPWSKPLKGFDRITSAMTHEYVAGRTKALAFGCARIVLNTMHYAEIRGVNVRLFEGTACGGFVLTHSGPELGRYFRPGTEVATFDSLSDLRDAIHYYVRAEDDRRSIATAGQARAHRDHTYKRRLEEMMRVIGLHDRFCTVN
jgi:spore maturation protein CgeB